MDSTGSRNILLAVLVIAIAVAVFYMIDPTLGGLIGRRRSILGFEGFADEHAAKGLAKAAPSASGMKRDIFQNGKAQAAAVAAAPHVASAPAEVAVDAMAPASPASAPSTEEGFASLDPSPMPFPEADKPANCYPKNQLSPQELLPNDPNSKWAQVNPMGQGDISGKNFLSAGALIGVNTVGQSMRNANLQLRSEPANPQVQVGPWMQSTIEPDMQRRPLDGI
jgi:hypothetical protein